VNAIIPQNGTGTNLTKTPPTTGPITGFVQISPAEVNLKHSACTGHAFANVTLYAGGGPALFGVEINCFNGIPFAVPPSGNTFAASVPLTALNDDWMWGGAAQVGTTYAFARGWFLDFAYTYARSANFTIENP
jgi:opacity protein-like surface antigen